MRNGLFALYLNLEREMLVLDDNNEGLADQIRDLMDPIWYALSGEQHALLNQRSVSFETTSEYVFPGKDLFATPPNIAESDETREPIVGSDWAMTGS